MTQTHLDDAALDWAIRVAAPAFDDWDGFTAWLEADPAHAEAYDGAAVALAATDRQVAALPVTPPVVDTETVAPRRWRRWAGAALAAALVGTIGMTVWTERAQPYAVETAAGQQRVIALDDGSEIVLAGGSRVELDRAEPRFATVRRGEMLFRVRHDSSHPFQVRANGLELTDLGTVFDVKLDDRVTRVAVADGAVLVDSAGAALRLDPGQSVVATGSELQRQTVEVRSVGAWREGTLVFEDTTLAEVAADLTRHVGHSIVVTPAIAQRRFRGTLDVRRVGADPRLLGNLLDVRVRVNNGGWTLEPR